MKYNMKEVSELRPDYLGFIFWEPSSRYFNQEVPVIPLGIKKVGVFVDATVEEVMEKAKTHQLDAVQLHGKESPKYCQQIKSDRSQYKNQIDVIKVFPIKDKFNFSVLKTYEAYCDYFLFDTKGKLPGGNGYVFDWTVLKEYPSTKPYFLSGGIGLENTKDIMEFLKRPESKYCHAIDVNSRFEIEPGLKNIKELKKFKKLLSIQN